MNRKARFLANGPAIGKKSRAEDRPSLSHHRQQGGMQTLPRALRTAGHPGTCLCIIDA